MKGNNKTMTEETYNITEMMIRNRENMQPKVLFSVVIDCSPSMENIDKNTGEPRWQRVEKALTQLVESLKKQHEAKRRIDISYTLFDEEVFKHVPFHSIAETNVPAIKPNRGSRGTNYTNALNKALDDIQEYREAVEESEGQLYNDSYLLFYTDGLANETEMLAREALTPGFNRNNNDTYNEYKKYFNYYEPHWKKLEERMQAEQSKKTGRIFFLPVLTGVEQGMRVPGDNGTEIYKPSIDEYAVYQLAKTETAGNLKFKLMKHADDDLEEYFQWVSKSLTTVSQSQPGNNDGTNNIEIQGKDIIQLEFS